jgi:predicted HicB family RNase H-like nuclease
MAGTQSKTLTVRISPLLVAGVDQRATEQRISRAAWQREAIIAQL